MKQYLIIQTAFIGDVILATSVVESLKNVSNEVSIDFIVRNGNENVLENNPNLRHVFVWDKKNKKYKNLFSIIKQIRQTKYDAVINLHRFFNSGLITYRAKANEKIGFKQNPWSFCYTKKIKFSATDGKHEIERNHQLIEHIAGEKPAKPRLYPTEEQVNQFQNVNKPYITIAPASVWFTKQLPKEQWIKFINDHLPDNFTVCLLGAPNDKPLCEAIKASVTKNEVIDFSGKLTLLESAALMRNATMNYSNDSAPMHLASAVNAPVTAIYCSTVPLFGFGPLSDNSRIVQATTDLNCRPCGLHGKSACPEKHFKCAYDINLKELLF